MDKDHAEDQREPQPVDDLRLQLIVERNPLLPPIDYQRVTIHLIKIYLILKLSNEYFP